MDLLYELQHRIIRRLLDASESPIDDLVRSAGIGATRRLRVYVGNAQENFAASLRSSFPVTLRLTGREYFDSAARRFQGLNPSRSGDLLHVGAAFPLFLAHCHQTDGYAYIGEVARFEWISQLALLAADTSPISHAALQRLAIADYATLKFDLHPSLRLFRSQYPCWQIWEIHRRGDADRQDVKLDAEGDCLAISVSVHRLNVSRLSTAEYAFLDSLSVGTPLHRAVEVAMTCTPEFDAAEMLMRCARANWFIDCRSTP